MECWVLSERLEKVWVVPVVVCQVTTAPPELSSSTRYWDAPVTAAQETGWLATPPDLAAVPRVTEAGAAMEGQPGVVNVAVLV
jgi:hypothetical protein